MRGKYSGVTPPPLYQRSNPSSLTSHKSSSHLDFPLLSLYSKISSNKPPSPSLPTHTQPVARTALALSGDVTNLSDVRRGGFATIDWTPQRREREKQDLGRACLQLEEDRIELKRGTGRDGN
jgi:hypothetical protein